MTPQKRRHFERLLNPRHIAFIGGADAIIAIGEARRRGFEGNYWPVNPRRDQMGGLACFDSVDDLPEAPDAVFLAIPAAAAVDTLEKLEKMGAGGVVCYAAGFKESGPDGDALEQRLKDIVGDMALIGPNCYGVINYLDNVALWPFAHGGKSPGYGAAIITQSGMFSSDITMSQRSLPLTHLISAGNQAVLELADFVDVLCENPAVRAIGVHIEGLGDVAKFEQAALKCLRNDTPIVALKTGSSQIGSQLTVSHTGSLSGTKELYNALFERCGVISVTNPSQMLETLKYLCVVRRPKGHRVVGFTCSGGGATMLADHAETIGLQFPSFTQDVTARLTKALPTIATVSNPLDYTTPIWGQPAYTEPVFRAAIDASSADAALLVQDYPYTGLDDSQIYYRNDAAAFSKAAKAAKVPAAVCATLPENMDIETRELLIEHGVAPMQGIHEALNAVAQAAAWHKKRAEILASPVAAMQPAGDIRPSQLVSEAAGKAILKSSGIKVPNGVQTQGSTAGTVACDIGFPVALKMMGPKLAHKTEAGAVALALGSPSEVITALAMMQKAVGEYDLSALTDDFLIEAHAPQPLAEMVIGLRRDPQFGWSLTLGSGGIYVELLKDTKTLLLPTDESQIAKAIRDLKLFAFIDGFRNRPKTDLAALSAQILTLCRFVQNTQNHMQEIEINPLFIYETHSLAVDALVRRDVVPPA